MSGQPVVIHGNLRSDGSLELAAKPNLPPGPVEVTLRPLPVDQSGGGDWWEYLQKARAELEAAGHPFRTKEEIDADLADLRSGDERIEQAYGDGTAG